MSHNLRLRLIILLIGLSPLMVITLGYLVYDPFYVLKSYQNYSNSRVILDRDYVSTQSFINRYQIYKYDSFIFGSSRTVAFRPETWKGYLNDNNQVFLFDASSETIYGIHLKIKYLDKLGIDIKNALLVLCRDCSFGQDKNSIQHLSIKHPALTGESRMAFHMVFFRAYLNPMFLASYYTYKYTGNYYKWMNEYIELRNVSYDPVTNQMELPDIEESIYKDPDSYYRSMAKVFYKRGPSQKDSQGRITDNDKQRFREIKDTFIRHNTDYRIVLSPLYEQIAFSSEDVSFLQELFPNRVYDFSGKNAFTDSIYNYYESSHYRPQVGDQIMKIIYKQ